jgi:cell division protease FtsH
MVCIYGMSESIGLAHCGQKESPFLLGALEGAIQRDCSEETAREVDEEVKNLLDHAYEEARGILAEHRGQLDLVAEELLKHETLDGKTFSELISRPIPAGHPDGHATIRGAAEAP